MIDTFEKVGGLHPGFRRNHAKGVCISGYFNSNGQGVALSKAAIFPSGRVPIIGRFALAGGQPYVTDAPHTVRSMAILFKLPDGEEWRSGMNNIPVFSVKTAPGISRSVASVGAGPGDRQTRSCQNESLPGRLSGNRESHAVDRQSSGLVRVRQQHHNGLDAFRFINASGAVTPVRWAMVPVHPFEPISTTDPGKADKNYLFDALIAAIHSHPLQWHLVVTIGQPGDPTNDATIPWPPDR
jgi:catalase